MDDIEKRAREIWIATNERHGYGFTATDLRSGNLNEEDKLAEQAIIAALSAAPQGDEVQVAPGMRIAPWAIEYAEKLGRYMESKGTGPWKLCGVQRRDDQAPSRGVPDDVLRDAERYRWLRENSDVDPIFAEVVGLTFPAPNTLDGFNSIDEAVDAAMQEPQA